MRKILLTCFILVLLPGVIFAQQAVHDAIVYINQLLKSAQDEIYQQMDLDFQASQLGQTGEILRTSVDTLKTAQDTYRTCSDMYREVMNVRDYIGDPLKLASYLNSRYFHSNELGGLIGMTDTIMNRSDSSMSNLDTIDRLLRDADYALRDIESDKARERAVRQKAALLAKEWLREKPRRLRDALEDFYKEDKKLRPDAPLNEIAHAQYKTEIENQGTLKDINATQALYAQMMANKYYNDEVEADRKALNEARGIYQDHKASEEMAKAMKENESLSDRFIRIFILGK